MGEPNSAGELPERGGGQASVVDGFRDHNGDRPVWWHAEGIAEAESFMRSPWAAQGTVLRRCRACGGRGRQRPRAERRRNGGSGTTQVEAYSIARTGHQLPIQGTAMASYAIHFTGLDGNGSTGGNRSPSPIPAAKPPLPAPR
jgi:hypothetical protein